MPSIYRKSPKELLIYFLIFNLAMGAMIIMDSLGYAYWVCLIKKANAPLCSNLGSYLMDHLTTFPVVIPFYSMLFLVPVFFIYCRLLDYFQRKISGKKAPYIACGICMVPLIEVLFRGLVPKASGEILLILASLTFLALFKISLDMLSKMINKKVFYIISFLLIGSTVYSLVYDLRAAVFVMIFYTLLLFISIGILKALATLKGH